MAKKNRKSKRKGLGAAATVCVAKDDYVAKAKQAIWQALASAKHAAEAADHGECADSDYSLVGAFQSIGKADVLMAIVGGDKHVKDAYNTALQTVHKAFQHLQTGGKCNR